MKKIEFWCWMSNNGDGSASANFYRTEKLAQAASDKDMEDYGENLTDDVSPITIILDDDYNFVEQE